MVRTRMAFLIRTASLSALLALLPAGSAGCGTADSGRAIADGGGAPDGATPADALAAAGDGPTTGTPSFSRDVAPLLQKRCTGYCHPGSYAPMSLRSADSYATLVGVPSVGCDGKRLRVKPGYPDPQDSDLMAKLTGVSICGNGQRMPPGGAPLAEAELRVLRDWIAAGAPND